VLAVVAGPPCLDRLVADGRGGFFGTYLDARRVAARALRRRDAALVDSRLIDVPPLREFDGYVVREVVLRTSEPRIAVLHGKPYAEQTRRPILTLHDSDTLEERSSTTLELRPSYTFVEDRDGALAIVSNDARTVGWFEPESQQLLDPIAIPLDRGLFMSLHEAVLGPATGELFVLGQGEVQLYGLARGRTELVHHAVFSTALELAITAIHWPADPSLLLVGGASPPGEEVRQATLTFFDLERRRFSPHAWSIGPGLPIADAQRREGPRVVHHPGRRRARARDAAVSRAEVPKTERSARPCAKFGAC
jgi:hypothetical protein